MLVHAEFERWRTAAEDASRAAEVHAAATLHNWACFMAEQSAQLAMRALLHGIGSGAWGHDLVRLSAAIADAAGEPLDGDAIAAVMRLSRHYIPTRYPDAHASGAPAVHYSGEDAVDALVDMQAVHGSIDGLWEALVRAESVEANGHELTEADAEEGAGGS